VTECHGSVNEGISEGAPSHNRKLSHSSGVGVRALIESEDYIPKII
jgi:hypothetical protein